MSKEKKFHIDAVVSQQGVLFGDELQMKIESVATTTNE